MSSGKRQAESEGFDWSSIPYKKIGIILLVIAVVIIAIVFAVHMINKRKVIDEANANSNIVENETSTDDTMPEEYEGYKVLGQLVIEKLGTEQYILDSKEDSAMGISPVKFYGTDINTEGNFCIVGHNYEGVFDKLNQLEVGDEFYIIDREEVIQDYVIKEIKEIEPTDLNVFMSVKDKIQVTLITCIEGATKRLAIIAERIDIEG